MVDISIRNSIALAILQGSKSASWVSFKDMQANRYTAERIFGRNILVAESPAAKQAADKIAELVSQGKLAAARTESYAPGGNGYAPKFRPAAEIYANDTSGIAAIARDDGSFTQSSWYDPVTGARVEGLPTVSRHNLKIYRH